ncbi:peptidoglycan/xylan/chitin deacetylase (PgdA/CDA1 family) [Roseimicrobium gellanilyticum]|uniref:Peptidoglycan/xylan/chitin deacetylase (PgdA/CDA1 family) n=1 Tax=Roseimicrobium gellanilyticum TaxID=748857 RepID=A0A366HTU2_9BACT|nr:polysaccharide deacetylase family protein [Roseimicrobium gellanilyticum]RBP47701.1 peptidoglycan/xylan/chitin deacetylase (PgdA/CDA1 family) [Roseimicrobium gellanilyticum]
MTWRRLLRRTVILWNVAAPFAAIALVMSGLLWWALGLLMTGHALWLISTLIPACQWCGEVVTTLSQARGEKEPVGAESKEVWLTIDDGPHPEDTPRLLDLLDAHQARATFFFIGANAKKHRKLVRQVIKRGHEVANHTMNHPQYWYWAYGPGSAEREIDECQKVLSDVADVTPRWFRAPAGFKNPIVQQHVEKTGLRVAAWSARGHDGVVTDKERVLQRLYSEIQPGGIILMHEGRVADGGGRLAPQVLDELLKWLGEKGYRCVVP